MLNGPSRKTSKGKKQIPLQKQEPSPPQLYRKMQFLFSPITLLHICILLCQGKNGKESDSRNSPVSNQHHSIIGKHGYWPQLVSSATPKKPKRPKKPFKKALSSHLGFEIFFLTRSVVHVL